MVDDNPGLLQLRILQQLGGSSGNTIMLGMPGADGHAGPPPTRAAAAAAEPSRPRRASDRTAED
jgi:hypothetical protein